jgi:hypothetical protein
MRHFLVPPLVVAVTSFFFSIRSIAAPLASAEMLAQATRAEGKARASRNAWKGGTRERCRALSALLRDIGSGLGYTRR